MSILTEKEAIFRYKKRSIAKMTSLKIKIGKSFRIALIKAICETASHKIKFSETIKKKNFNSLARKILFDIEFNKLSKNAKNLFFNIKNLKQELNKLDNNNINQFIEILETLPIPKFKLQESLVSAELCKLKNEFLQSLEKLQHILNESFYENPPSFLFSQKEDVFNKMKDGPKVIQKKKWNKISTKETFQLKSPLRNFKFNNRIHELIIIHAPINEIVNKLTLKGFYNFTKHRFKFNRLIAFLENHQIVNCYEQLIYTLLNYYAVCDNNLNIKTLVFQLKLSCVYTLAHKHKKSAQWAYLKFGKNCTILNGNNEILAELPSDRFIYEKSTKYHKLETKLSINIELSNIFKKYNFALYTPKTFLLNCVVKDCTNCNIEIYHIKKLYKKIKTNDIISVVDTKGRKITGMDSILTFLNKKQIFLCKQHHYEFNHWKFSKINVDFFTKIYLIKIINLICLNRGQFWNAITAKMRFLLIPITPFL